MNIKKIFCVFLTILMLLTSLISCDAPKKDKDGEDKGGSYDVYEISFAESNSIEEMQKHDGETVTVMGYMSTLSAVDGSFTYLMNAPYQSCPYCVPNTTQLSNTIAVYAKKGKRLEFTDLLIQVTGTLEFGEYKDEYGYTYSYRIKDATYVTVSADDLTKEQKLWQQLAATGVVSKIFNEMYNYVNYVCNWGTYYAQFGEGQDYLYPTDAQSFIASADAQFGYGAQPDYFKNLIKKIEEVDKNAFADLVKLIKDAEALARDAEQALNSGAYEAVTEYSNVFGDGRVQYRAIAHEEFNSRMDAIFYGIAAWNSEWELS